MAILVNAQFLNKILENPEIFGHDVDNASDEHGRIDRDVGDCGNTVSAQESSSALGMACVSST